MFAGVVFPTAAEGVDPVLGVQNGAYFNVRSPLSKHYIDEYQNVNGVAVATGKSYPTSDYVQDISKHIALPFVLETVYKLNQRVVLTNGDIVKSTVDGNTNDPNVDMTGWAYSSLTPSNNLSDVADKGAARNNLSVYSKGEVDAKKSTESEAISGTNNTKFVTPLSLSAAIKALTINSALTQRDVKAQRFLNTNYTNSSASMKIILVGFKLPQNANVSLSVGGLIQGFVTNITPQLTENYLSLVGFIKPNETYIFNVVTGSPTIQFCMEISL